MSFTEGEGSEGLRRGAEERGWEQKEGEAEEKEKTEVETKAERQTERDKEAERERGTKACRVSSEVPLG